MPAASVFAATLALATIASVHAQGVCPEAFEITSTRGALFTSDNGTQFPGPANTGLEETKFQLTSSGNLITASGVNCAFSPWLTCGSQVSLSPYDQVSLDQYGAISLVKQDNGSDFYACTPDGLGNVFINPSLTVTISPTPTGTATSSNAQATVIPEYYVIPDYLATYARGNEGCNRVGLQASRCSPFNATTTLPTPVSTYSSSADKMVGLHDLTTLGGIAALLGAYLL